MSVSFLSVCFLFCVALVSAFPVDRRICSSCGQCSVRENGNACAERGALWCLDFGTAAACRNGEFLPETAGNAGASNLEPVTIRNRGNRGVASGYAPTQSEPRVRQQWRDPKSKRFAKQPKAKKCGGKWRYRPIGGAASVTSYDKQWELDC